MRGLKINTLVIHIAGWLLFMLLPLLFLNGGREEGTVLKLLLSPFYWLFAVTYLALFYLNYFYFVPFLLLKRRYLIYLFIVTGLGASVYFLQPFDRLLRHNRPPRVEMRDARPDDMRPQEPPNDFGPPPPPPEQMHERGRPPGGDPFRRGPGHIDMVSMLLFFIIAALSLSVRTAQEWNLTEQRVVKAESEKVNAELSFLKAQINPHFLFNTLNNIYTLSMMQSEHTSESIMKLSNIMRYVTDDVTHDFVPLQNDINCISDYIDLQKLRLGKKTEVHFVVMGETTGLTIAPLILMSFIENTFKYGISKQQPGVISIAISIDEKAINFTCENQIFNQPISDRSGIGIANTRQRLKHLYPNKHTLNILQEDGWFKVSLTLQA